MAFFFGILFAVAHRENYNDSSRCDRLGSLSSYRIVLGARGGVEAVGIGLSNLIGAIAIDVWPKNIKSAMVLAVA